MSQELLLHLKRGTGLTQKRAVLVAEGVPANAAKSGRCGRVASPG